ncbi:DDB1- and CUL4-associated factor 4 [Microbotryomycetes sp. JL221]|nr:DDB1- and CUL4-associated factor 4 [Microbotryomycetes sp. JL221]
MRDDDDDNDQLPRRRLPPAPFEMPGYEWDGKRFYKAQPGKQTTRAHKRLDSDTHKRNDDTQHDMTIKRNSKATSRPWHRSWPTLDSSLVTDEPHRASSIEQRHHYLDGLALSRARLVETIEIDCLTVDQDVTCIDFDSQDDNTIRIGGSFGSIATGYLKRPDDDIGWFPNDEHAFRMTYMLPNKVTSLSTCHSFLLATSFGSPAKALYSSTKDNNNVSLAPILLSPGKTSIWSSAQSGQAIALGCDKGVMLSRDPASSHTHTYVTGGKGGGGTVFALDMTDNLIFAGTRKGHVRLFDQRCDPQSYRTNNNGGLSQAQLVIPIPSPVTHCRRVKHGLLVATMSGGLELYDMRFIKQEKPVLNCKGHVNNVSTDLGFDVWRDEFVAMAGEDDKESILLSRRYSSTIKAIKFSGSRRFDRFGSRRDDGQPRINRQGMETQDQSLLHFDEPTLWIANGPVIEKFQLSLK